MTAAAGRGRLKMKDVARDLGMSVATVSRVLSQPELVSAATAARVREAIDRLGYRPNLTARDLRRQETRIILVVVPRLSPFFLDVLRGAEAAAHEQGYTVLMAYSGGNPHREGRFLDQVLSRRADGAILVTSVDAAALAARGPALPPVVAALEPVDGLGLPTVRVDNVAAAMAATDYLVTLGHRRIAHISGPDDVPMAQHRAEGFGLAIARAGLDDGACHRIAGDFTLASGERAMARLLTRNPRPTAVFVANDEMAVGAVQVIRKAGLTVGDDISVIGFDDQRIANLYEPSLTTVHVPTADLGHEAVMQLVEAMAGRPAARDIVLTTRLVIRDTTGPART
ncbi:LacI family DNA-binding transcriptional regulator [Sphingomonas quercus]|uniref:LacI family transcriptional regulator n=1 Tax=Sphingomonas quercus TaxID=2842451 RepID=A0ABS6BKZ6_9SPHN|nr:LacI family DNA-binding transcriptional regulator [Sphingomonas quercus]MBU3077905.1 LacI family transcriptional regulator [Sphingomonas quercus]